MWHFLKLQWHFLALCMAFFESDQLATLPRYLSQNLKIYVDHMKREKIKDKVREDHGFLKRKVQSFIIVV